jgi:hypothetical protein
MTPEKSQFLLDISKYDCTKSFDFTEYISTYTIDR